MLTLAIDTCTSILSVALVRGDEVLASVDEQTKNNQSEILMSRIECMVNDCNLKPADLEKIAVSVGPGSYTGIRVGVAAVKSLGYALDIPVIGVSSLEVMAMAAVSHGIRIPMIDARRESVFSGVYGCDGTSIIPDGHYLLEKLIVELIPIFPPSDIVFFVGDGAALNKETLHETWSDAQVVSESAFERSKAEVLASLAMNRSPHENIHSLVPNYLRKTEAEMNAGG